MTQPINVQFVVHKCEPPQRQGEGYGCPFHHEGACRHFAAPGDYADWGALYAYTPDSEPPSLCPLKAAETLVRLPRS